MKRYIVSLAAVAAFSVSAQTNAELTNLALHSCKLVGLQAGNIALQRDVKGDSAESYQTAMEWAEETGNDSDNRITYVGSMLSINKISRIAHPILLEVVIKTYKRPASSSEDVISVSLKTQMNANKDCLVELGSYLTGE